jgi:mannose-6-phosphate isomerase-like protein (cupin superfamily)
MSIERIEVNGLLYALVFRRNLSVGDGVRFLTPSDYPLQLGLIERKAGYAFRPHIHNDFRYEVNTTQEFLYIEQGRIRAKIYDHDWNVVAETELGPGDFLLSVAGGHSFDVLEDVRLIEVKQGPYPGDSYAKRFKE